MDKLSWLVCDEWDRVTAEGQGEQLRRCVAEVRRQKLGEKRRPHGAGDASSSSSSFDSEYDLPSPWSAGLLAPFRVVLLSATLGSDMRGMAATSLTTLPWLVDGDKGAVKVLGMETAGLGSETELPDAAAGVDAADAPGGASSGSTDAPGTDGDETSSSVGGVGSLELGPIASTGQGPGNGTSSAVAGPSTRLLHAPP